MKTFSNNHIMRKTVIALFVLTLTTFTGYCVPISFSVEYESSQEDGSTMTYLRFKSGDKKILLYPSKAWDIRGTPQAAFFALKDVPYAEAKFENAPTGMPVSFDEKNLETYRQLADSLLPKSITELAPLSEQQDSVQINGWKSFEQTYQYTYENLKFTHSIIIIKLGDEREMLITITARDTDYERLREGVHGILNSWNEPE